jgi:hypothetical protein
MFEGINYQVNSIASKTSAMAILSYFFRCPRYAAG